MSSITSTPHPTDLNLVVLTRTCPFCGKEHSITVNKLEYLDGTAAVYQGALIQRAFPNFSPDEREFIKTGICPTCWDNM